MTKRRLLIIALALVAVGVAVPVVPWAIVEWHVREIAADRQALLDALEAPEGSWEWRAVEEYATRPAGEEALRREYVSWALCWEHRRLRHFKGDAVLRDALTYQTHLFGWRNCNWMMWGAEAGRWYNVRRHLNEKFPTYGGPMDHPKFRMDFRTDVSYASRPIDIAPLIERLTLIVRPSPGPVAVAPAVAVHVVRLGDPIIPVEGIEGFNDPDTLVVFAKLREPNGEVAADLTGPEKTDSSP